MNSERRRIIIEIVLLFLLVLGGALGKIIPWYVILGVFAGAALAYITVMCSLCQRKMASIYKNVNAKLDEIKGFQDEIKGLQDILSGDMKVISTPQIIEIEEKVEKEVWIATFDISFDLKFFLKVGKKNLERGVVYKYYIPRECEADFNELRSNLEKVGMKEDALKLHTVKYISSYFIPFNIVLYDPSIRKCGYIYSPQIDTNLFIEFDRQSFRQVRNYFMHLEKMHTAEANNHDT